MCGRFFVAEDAPEELTRMLSALETRAQQLDPSFRLKRGEICPGDTAAVLALNRRMVPTVFVLTWGFRLGRKLVFNARVESAMDKPMFRESYRLRRCLIPASAYIEWDHRQQKPAKSCFRPKDSRMLYLCGLYRVEDDPGKPAFTIPTHDAAAHLRCFHDRMPVIAPLDMARQWLAQDADPAIVIPHTLECMTFAPA